GYAFAINGKVYAADVYASAALFRKLWPRLVRANAIEAVADLQKDKKFEPVGAAAVVALLGDAAKGKEAKREVSDRIRLTTYESQRTMLFETRDRDQRDTWIRRNYLAK